MLLLPFYHLYLECCRDCKGFLRAKGEDLLAYISPFVELFVVGAFPLPPTFNILVCFQSLRNANVGLLANPHIEEVSNAWLTLNSMLAMFSCWELQRWGLKEPFFVISMFKTKIFMYYL